jgi:hypothetical protein
MSARNYCEGRTGISLVMGTIGRCERPAGHQGPHGEQRQDNGAQHTWTDKPDPRKHADRDRA